MQSAETRFNRSTEDFSELEEISSRDIYSEFAIRVCILTEIMEISKIHSLQHVDKRRNYGLPKHIQDQ